MEISIDGQGRLVRLVHLQIGNFIKRTNDKLPFAQGANGKQNKENHLGFGFPSIYV
jgi:hypothetical protein